VAEAALSGRAATAEDAAAAADAKAHAAAALAGEAHAATRLSDHALRDCKSALAVAVADGKAAAAKAAAAADRVAEVERVARLGFVHLSSCSCFVSSSSLSSRLDARVYCSPTGALRLPQAEAELEGTLERQAKTQRELKASGAKAKLLLGEAQEALAAQQSEWKLEKAVLEQQSARLASELDELKRSLGFSQLRSGGGSNGNLSGKSSSSGSLSGGGSGGGTGTGGGGGAEDDVQVRGMLSDLVSEPGHQPGAQGSALARAAGGGGSMRHGGGVGFVVELEKLHLLVKQREAEAKQAKERLKQVPVDRTRAHAREWPRTTPHQTAHESNIRDRGSD
jgi:uncharacterized membrane protein YgcG